MEYCNGYMIDNGDGTEVLFAVKGHIILISDEHKIGKDFDTRGRVWTRHYDELPTQAMFIGRYPAPKETK
jgi:hypothetical protein